MTRRSKPVALVTGAGKKLGRSIAIRLAREGFDIALHYFASSDGVKATKKAIQDSGGEGMIYRANIRNVPEIRRMVVKVLDHYGRIDVLVNNAAVFAESSIIGTSEKLWDQVIETNLKGQYFCSKFVAPIMLRQGRGKIINIASLGGIQAWSRHAPYSISKAGVIMLTRLLAKELAPYVQVNAIAPGVVDFGLEDDPSQSRIPPAKIPLRRYAKPEDVTSLVAYLANSGNYITGQTLSVDGGRSI